MDEHGQTEMHREQVEQQAELESLVREIESQLERARRLSESHLGEMQAATEREASMVQREQETAQRFHARESAIRTRHEHLRRELASMRTQLGSLREAHAAAVERANELEEAVRQHQQEAADAHARTAEADARAESLQQEVNARPSSSQLESLVRERDEARERVAQLESALESAATSMRERTAELQAQVDEAREACSNFQRQLAEVTTELNDRPGSEQLDSFARERDEARARVAELESALESAAASMRERTAELQAQVDEAREAGASAQQQLADVTTELNNRPGSEQLDSLARERDEAQARVTQLESDLASATTGADEHTTALQAQVDEAREACSNFQQQLAEVTTELNDRPRPDDISRLEHERDTLARELDELRNAPAPEAPAPETPDTSQWETEIAKRDLAIQTLHAKLNEQNAALAAAAESPTEPAAVPVDDGRLALRRERLARVRQSLRARRTQLSNDATQLLTDRDRLVEAERSVVAAQRRVDAQRAQFQSGSADVSGPKSPASSAAMTLAAMVLTIVAMVGASWIVAGRFVTPTYRVQTTLGMEARDGASAESLESWQSFHASLAEDPNFLDETAERMRRRGIDILATPADVRQFVSDDMDITFDGRGEVALTLRAEGRSRAERLLETYASSMVAWSNTTRSSRLDSSGMVVVEPVSADHEPLEDPRLAAFGAVLGAMTAIALFGFVILMRVFNGRLKKLEAIEERAKASEREWSKLTE